MSDLPKEHRCMHCGDWFHNAHCCPVLNRHAQPAPSITERQSKWGQLYTAANALIVAIGFHGRLDTDSPEVESLQDKLHDLDSGEWMPGLMPAQPEPAASAADGGAAKVCLRKLLKKSPDMGAVRPRNRSRPRDWRQGMTDRELLENAAKAAGIELRWHKNEATETFPYAEEWCFIPRAKEPHNRRAGDWMNGEIWNPLIDDGDALRLAVKLRIVIDVGSIAAHVYKDGPGVVVPLDPEPYAATRRAIVRAAAAIGAAK